MWRFANEPAPTINTEIKYSTGQIVQAWSPFILLTIMIIAWGMQPIKEVLNAIGQFNLNFPGCIMQLVTGAENHFRIFTSLIICPQPEQ
jgi:L-lactate permease